MTSAPWEDQGRINGFASKVRGFLRALIGEGLVEKIDGKRGRRQALTERGAST